MDEIPESIFDEWRLLYDLEPWGEDRSDLAIGQLTAMMIALKGISPKEPEQYMRYLKRVQDEDEENRELPSDDDVLEAIAMLERGASENHG